MSDGEEIELESYATPALDELVRNLDYARDLVRGGRYLERLQVGAFDVADLYRAAWVQAVSAVDHWVHRELYDRGSAFALKAAQPPAKFLKIEVPMSLLETVMHDSAAMEEVFRAHLRTQFGHLSFQHPDKIKYAISFISDVSLWPGVAKRLGGDHTPKSVQDRLSAIVKRRNRIAHETDRDHQAGGVRTRISDGEVTEVIDWLETMSKAIFDVIGPPPQQTVPSAGEGDTAQKPKARWTRESVDEAVEAISGEPAGVAAKTLLAHADAGAALFKGGTSSEPSAGLYYWVEGKRRSLWSLYLTADRPVITMNFNSISSKDPRLALDMISLLRTQPSLDAALFYDDETTAQKYPSIELSILGEEPQAIETVLAALDMAIKPKSKLA